ncbi:hypothetical protein B0H34DRAFT_796543 [Crassisporium funariophilum]|nr:hypothetical protein B0H34DRAFT_796543 [Crassisporium funariophilum]
MPGSRQFNIVPLVVGAYLNMMLYTLELVSFHIYFIESQRSKRDPGVLKCAALLSLFSDTLGTMSVCAMTSILVFSHDTTYYDDVESIVWPFFIWIITNGISAVVFQLFMIHRYWKFVVLGTAMLTDIAIATALILQLQRKRVYSRQTKNLIKRISSLSMKTGVVPGLFALATLVGYLAYRNGTIAFCFAFMLARVYTLTMLFTLIYRDKLQPDLLINIDIAVESRGTNGTPLTNMVQVKTTDAPVTPPPSLRAPTDSHPQSPLKQSCTSTIFSLTAEHPEHV